MALHENARESFQGGSFKGRSTDRRGVEWGVVPSKLGRTLGGTSKTIQINGRKNGKSNRAVKNGDRAHILGLKGLFQVGVGAKG